MWYTSATAIKVFLCIGILLLIIGFFYICRDWYITEPFQTAANFCTSDSGKCTLECNTNLNDPLLPETVNEQSAYDLYDAENLQNIEPPPTTPIKAYNPASQLSDFVVGANVPWDYDNRSMDPQSILWGVVMPSCSMDIYYKAYHRQVYGSGNNMEYNPADRTGPAYVDPIFNVGTNDSTVQAGLEAADFLFQSIGGIFMSEPIKFITLGTWNYEAYERGREVVDRFKIDAKRGYSVDPSDEFVRDSNGNPTTERTPPDKRVQIKPVIDPSTGEALTRPLTDAEISNRLNNIMNSTIADSRARQLALSINDTVGGTISQREALLESSLRTAGFKDPKKSTAQAIQDAANKRKAADIIANGTEKPSSRAALMASSLGRRLERIGTYIKDTKVGGVIGVLRRANLRLRAAIGKPAMSLGSSKILARVTTSLGKFAALVTKAVEGAGICQGIVTLACISTASPVPAGPGSTVCLVLNILITFITQAIIPSILQALTVDDSVCPPGMTTIYDAMKNAEGGSTIGFTIMSMIPGPLGDFVTATGEFICWKVNVNTLIAVFTPAIVGAGAAATAAYSSVFAPCQSGVVAAAAVTFGASLAATAGCIAAASGAAAGIGFTTALAGIAIGGAIEGLISAETNKNNAGGYIDNLKGTFQPTKDSFSYAGITSSLKIPYAYPAYYFDSTLSIFFDNKPQPLNYTAGNWADPYSYVNNDGVMPIWVDFSDTRLLDKMAQFYNDYSRLFMTSNPDGSVSFQYITKMYAVVASSKYCCDIQCGLNSITFMPYSGLVLCDIPVPMDPGSATLYHDRRFYFRVDMTQGAQGAARDALRGEARMTDNVAKYIVCGCTNSDGSGPDAIDVTSAAGTEVSDAVVTLGDVFDSTKHSTQEVANTTAIGTSVTIGNTSKTIREIARSLAIAAGGVTPTFPISSSSLASVYANTLPIITNPSQDELANTIVKNALTAAGLGIGNNAKMQMPSIPGYYYAPAFSDIHTLISKVPLDQTCNITARAYTRYGRASESDIQAVRTGMPINNTGAPSMDRMLLPYQWSGAKEYYNKHPSAKFFQVVMQDRGVNTAGSANQIGSAFGQNLAENGIPLILGFASPGLGMAAGAGVAALQYTGMSNLVSCSYQDARKNDGNFVLNDMLFTSEHKTFVNRGPVIKYAPGYTPTVNRCAKVYLQQSDCVSRYSIRRFLKKFNDEIGVSAPPATTSTYKKIMHLINIETIQNIGSTLAPQCIYTVGVGTFDRATKEQTGPEVKQTYGLQCAIANGDTTCSYTPAQNISLTDYTNSVAPTQSPIVFLGKTGPLKSFPIVTENPNFRRPTCGDSSYTTLKCDHPTLKASLIQAFNKAHIASAHLDPTNGILGKSLTLGKNANDAQCVYYANVLDVFKGTYTAHYITMDLNISLMDSCLYTLASDDYPERFYFSSIPAKPFTIPDVADPVPQVTLPTPGCATGATTDCSGTAIIQNLVSQFNSAYTDRQIFKVLSASTPNATTCEYQVEMSRKVSTNANTNVKSNIVLMDSVRMTVRQSTADRCLYDRVSDTSATILSTQTFQGPNPPPPLKTPYVWSNSILKTAGTSLNTYIQSFLGLDIKGALDTAAKGTTNEVYTVLNQVQTPNMPLSNCPTQKCENQSVMQAIVNRYNYDNFPTEQYGVQQSQITEIRRAGGVPAPTNQSCCQFELIQRVDYYADFLQNPIPSNTQFYLRQYQFYLLNSGQQCTYTVKPLTEADISNNIIDISGNAYGILSNASLLQTPSQFTLNMIDYGNTAVLASVKTVYESINVAPPGTPALYNKLKSIQRAFNSRPNVCEYKATVDRTLYDADYGVSYIVRNDTTYLRATWPTYMVDTNTFTGAPVVEEFFPPQISIKTVGTGTNATIQATKTIYGVQTPVTLPYLYFENPKQGPTRVGTGPQGKGWILP